MNKTADQDKNQKVTNDDESTVEKKNSTFKASSFRFYFTYFIYLFIYTCLFWFFASKAMADAEFDKKLTLFALTGGGFAILLFIIRDSNRTDNLKKSSVDWELVRAKEQHAKYLKWFGKYAWATEYDLTYRLGGNDVNGIHIGDGHYWNEHGHMLTVGGAGSGKGINLILPVLLSNNFVRSGTSVVVLDPKGENAAVSAPFLKRSGYDVHILNPFQIPQITHLGNSQWNPFDLIQANEMKKMCDTLAFSIHNRQGTGDNSFFDNKCRNYISLYMRYAIYTGNATINWVYNALLRPGEKRIKLLAEMAVDSNFSGAIEAENILASLMGETARTEENIFGTIHEAINIFGDDALRVSMEKSDFDLRQISQRPTAIFICIKHDELRYYAAWIRMFTDMLLKTLTNYYNPSRKVLVLLDEFAQLGYVNEFKNSPAILRGYNVTLWPVIQEIGQLKSLYGEQWETFISNAAVKHWLGGSMDNTTAEYIEKRLPFYSKLIGYHGRHNAEHRVDTKLMVAHEIMSMYGIICEISSLGRPAYFLKIPYFKDNILKQNASPNPFYN